MTMRQKRRLRKVSTFIKDAEANNPEERACEIIEAIQRIRETEEKTKKIEKIFKKVLTFQKYSVYLHYKTNRKFFG